eukprot:CFRG4689T1
MKTETCVFSGAKIYPGKGKRYVRLDGRVYNFLNNKCSSLFMQRKNPRKISWTVLFRRKAKKGTQTDESARRKTRKTQKVSRAVGGATLESLMAKRNQSAEVRKAQRDHHARASKDKVAAAKAAKKTTRSVHNKAPVSKNAPKQNIRSGGLR